MAYDRVWRSSLACLSAALGYDFLNSGIYPKIYPGRLWDAMVPGGTGWYLVCRK